MPVEIKTERIGLLFVHGVGEQKRWEHLKSSVQDMAELLLQSDDAPRTMIVDRTENWPHPPGDPDPTGLAPVTLEYKSAGRHVLFECHEVWWADLGERAGLGDVITFWLWGLGQWCAPIYRELDASSLPKNRVRKKPISTQAQMPESVAGRLVVEPLARLQLVLAALAAVFVACTWSLAKRLFAALLGQAPTPTLIVQYVGDVRTYEARGAPGDCALTDPGRPRRVGIRRRMVSQMIGLATGPCDGWYVLAHSLGTVVAYNGLTETGHALPNYLSEEQWGRVPKKFRRDSGCKKRDDVSAMMPTRPSWLVIDDVINRPLLFANLRGFLTYGSPLDKFASLWPRIVATATDREDKVRPFPPGCRWLNLVAPSDPVAGKLDSYSGDRIRKFIPAVKNIRIPWTPLYGLSHIQYFKGVERSNRGRGAGQKRQVAKWLLNSKQVIRDHPQHWLARLVSVQIAYPLLVALLWLIATGFVVGALDSARNLIGRTGCGLRVFYGHWLSGLPMVLAAVLAVILLMGLYRWRKESRLNARLAAADKEADRQRFKDKAQNRSSDEKSDEQETWAERSRYWNRLILMLRLQQAAGLTLLLAACVALLAGVTLDWGAAASAGDLTGGACEKGPSGLAEALHLLNHKWTIVIALAGLLLAAIVQTVLNRRVPPVGKAPG